MFVVLASCALALQSRPSANVSALWESGQRAEAIDALRAELGDASGGALSTLVAWQLAVHRPKQALADAIRCGSPCNELRADAHYALDEYELAVTLFNEDRALQALKKIDALEALQRFEESDAVLERANVRFADDPRFLVCRGRSCARAGRFDEAVRKFELARQWDPVDREALFGLGRALVSAGRRDEGLAVLAEHRRLLPLIDQLEFAQRSLDLAPTHAPNQTAVGDALRALGQFDDARRAYASAEKLGRGEEIVPNALRHARLLAEDLNDLGEALAVLERAAKNHPDPRLDVRRGDLLAGAGRRAEAISAYERALSVRPNDVEIQKRLDKARNER